jgi:hypothetical protein
MRKLQHDVRGPKARRPRGDRGVVDVYGSGGLVVARLSSTGAGGHWQGEGGGGEGYRDCGGYEVVCAEVGELLEVVEGEHGPALSALYREEAARWWGRALERDEPLNRR